MLHGQPARAVSLDLSATTRSPAEFASLASSKSINDTSLVGEWKFTSVFYRGQELPAPNPDLNLRYTFNADGTSRMYWDRANRAGFCERQGRYLIHDEILTDEVTWINPQNDSSCHQDPDMQVGTRSSVPFRFDHDRLVLDLPLGDESIGYIWTRADPSVRFRITAAR